MKHLKIYRAIRLIHRTGSIRKAAAELAISPSALNRSIQAFEDELSFAVFERLPGGVRLSEAGELLLDVIDRHLLEFHQLQSQLGSLRDGETGELRISIGDDIAAGLILEACLEMQERFPKVALDITYDTSVDSLRQRRVDLALLTNPATDDTTEVVHASACRIVACASGGETPRGIWDLSDTRVLLPGEATGTRTAINHVLRRNQLSFPKATALSASHLAQYHPAACAVAIFPEVIFGSGAKPLPFDFGTVQICILRMARRPLIRPAQTFIGVLQRRLDEALAA
ncbi:LysR family transcriptional regulator [Gymnodinialimonas sp.]